MRPHTVLESPAELRDAMRTEIRQLRAENQRLKSELAGKERVACPHCVRTDLSGGGLSDPHLHPRHTQAKGQRLGIPDQAQGRNRRHIYRAPCWRVGRHGSHGSFRAVAALCTPLDGAVTLRIRYLHAAAKDGQAKQAPLPTRPP